MTVPASVVALYGRRGKKSLPNIADSSSRTSIAIAESIFDMLGVDRFSTD